MQYYVKAEFAVMNLPARSMAKKNIPSIIKITIAYLILNIFISSIPDCT